MWRENDVLSVEGESIAPTEPTEKKGKYAHFTNMGGYVFFDDSKVTYNKSTKSNYRNADDKTTYDFAEIVINHGVGDGALNSSYAYAYLPTMTENETAGYSANPDTEILLLTEKAHAVYEKNLGILAINFFEAGVFEGKGYSIEAKTVCSVMIRDNVLYVSDPTCSLDAVELNINGKEISVNTKDTFGKTFTISL
jgi:hypothetical protein